VGRDRALAQLTARLSEPGSTLLVSGAAGIGKTHLARAALNRLAADGADTEEIVGGTNASRIPLGPAAHLVPPLSGDVPVAGLIASTLDRLNRRAADRHLVFLADDVDLLDDASSTLVGHLATAGQVSLVATSRESIFAGHPFAALARQGSLETLALTPLGASETAELAALHAGRRLDADSGLRLFDMTRGNPLFVTQLIRTAAARGALREDAGGLHLDTELAMGGLDRLLSERVDTLTHPESLALNLIAVGGPLPLSLLEKMVEPLALGALAQAGLVDIRGERAPVVRFAHPLYREIVRNRLQPVETRILLRQLLDVAGSPPVGEPDRDARALLLRLGLWHAELGLPFDPAAAGWAAREVHWGLLEVIRRHLAGETAADAGSDTVLAAGLDRVDQRSDAALLLAKGLWRDDPNFVNGARLAWVLGRRADRAAEMLELIAALGALAGTDEERSTLAIIHGTWLYWVARDRDGAAALLRRAEPGIGPPWRQTLAATRAGLDVHSGYISDSIQVLTEEAPAEDAPAVVKVLNWSPLAAALVTGGRLEAGVELARTALPLSTAVDDQLGRDHAMRAMEELTIIDHWGRMYLGRYDEVANDARMVSDLLKETDQDEGRALFMGLEASCRLMQARPATAEVLLAEAVRRHGPVSFLGFRSLLHSTRAVALAWLGRLAEAEVEAQECSRWHDPPRFFDAEVAVAQATVLAAAGQRSRAVEVTVAAAQDSARRGIWFHAFSASFVAARVSPDRAQLRLLRSTAAHVDGPLPALAMAYCTALSERDAAKLEDVARQALDAGETLFGLEAMTSALECATGSRRSRLQGVVTRLAEECEGARAPFSRGLSAPSGLTERELEVVSLAAQGWSSPAIAAELVRSVRTVETHLYRAFAKLGVRSRAELAERFASRFP
jgi:DNA-binding CsgD family transcriptional regulator